MKKIFGFAAMAALLFASCAKELDNGGMTAGDENSAFQITLQTSKGTLVTYADIATTPEWNFGDVTMFIYEAKADKSGALLNTNASDFTVDVQTGKTVLTASAAWLTANKGKSVNAYFVGNNEAANLFDNSAQATALATEKLFIEQLTEAQKLDAGKAELLTTPLLFSASAAAVVPSATKVTVPVTLKRREARFDIVNEEPTDFVISKVVVKNANLQGFIFADAETTPTIAAGNLKEIDCTGLTYDASDLAASVFYLYPTQLGVGSDTEIAVVATMTGGVETAYQVNSTAKIEANKRYKLIFDKAQLVYNVVAVDYEEGGELPVGTATAGITSFSAGTGTGTITNTSYELVAGENATLSVTLGGATAAGFDVTVSGAAGIVSQSAIAASENIGAITYAAAYFPVTYDIATTYAASVPGTEVVITFTEKGNTQNSASVLLYDGETRTVLAASNSYIVAPNSETIAIPVSRAYEHWNTALAADAIFDAEFVWTDVSAGMSADGAVADVYVKKSGADAVLYVKPGSAEGNAVVAVKVGGEIKWSWHIWNVSDKATIEAGVGNDSKWMDRNLGALSNSVGDAKSNGFIYQWGRKDPFPGGSTIIPDASSIELENGIFSAVSVKVYDKKGSEITYAHEDVNTTNNLDNAVKNPFIFYCAPSAPTDWLTNNSANQDNKLWGSVEANGSKIKTIYDPCPEGWTVPANNSYGWPTIDQTNWEQKFDGGNYLGWVNASFGGYYPAAPIKLFKNTDQGYLRIKNGMYWANIHSGTNARYWRLNPTNVVDYGGIGRATGLSVRCVKDVQ